MIRRRHVCLLAFAAALAAMPATAAAAGQEPASASVNVCGGGGTGDVGVRVSAPFRGDDVAPWVRITIQYYSDDDGGWHAATNGDSGWFQAARRGPAPTPATPSRTARPTRGASSSSGAWPRSSGAAAAAATSSSPRPAWWTGRGSPP